MTRGRRIWGAIAALATVVGLVTAYPSLEAMYREHVLDEPPLIPGTTAVILSKKDYEARQRALKQRIKTELRAAHADDKAELLRQLETVNARLADLPAAHAEAKARIRELERQLDSLSGQVSQQSLRDAKRALARGDTDAAKALFEEAAEAASGLAAGAAFGLCQIAEEEIRWHDAYTHYKRAVDLNATIDHLAAYARMTWRLAKGDEAVRAYETLVDRVDRSEGSNSPNYASALNNLALVVQAQGRHAEAEGLYREALEIDRATIGEEHPEYATRLNNLAIVVQDQGRHAEAEELYREARDITRATLGEGHPDYATRLNNLAGVVRAQGRHAEAEGLYREALEIDRATIGEGHPDYAARLNNLALVVQDQGRHAEAEGLYREARDITRATLGEGHPSYAISLGNLGRLLGETGRAEEGRAMLEQALDIFRATLPPDHPHIGVVERRLAALPDP